MTDPMCVTPASLPNDSFSRRIRQLMKIQKPCSDIEPAIDAYSARNECPRVSSWLSNIMPFFCCNLHSKFFPFSSQLVALGPDELGDWEKPKPEPKKKTKTKKTTEEKGDKEEEEDDEEE